MSSDRGSEGADSPEWVYVSSPDYQSPGETYLKLSPLSVMSPSISNRDTSIVTPATSPTGSPGCSIDVAPESYTAPRINTPQFAKIEFLCEGCASPPGSYNRATIHTSSLGDANKFTLLGPEDQGNGSARNSDQVGLFNNVGIETPSVEEAWRTRIAVAALNHESLSLAAAGYGPGEPPDHLWFTIEPYLRRHTFCKQCFLVFVKYGPIT